MSKPIDSAADSTGEQTDHHYELAHVALRHVALADPEGFFRIMRSGSRSRFLNDIFEQVCVHCDDDGPAPFGVADLKVSSKLLGSHSVILIEMPPAKFMAEAHMVCIAIAATALYQPAGSAPPALRYFTLENSYVGEDDAASTKFCEWREGQHANYGRGPEATPQAFLERVAGVLSGVG
jgi:hypothetical protein